MMKALTVVLLGALLATDARAQGKCEGISGFTQWTYKTTLTRDLCAYVLKPVGTAVEAPAILFFFGGGWRSGTPSQFASQARYAASRGMAALLMDYRTYRSDGTTPFQAVEDARSAMRWVRVHARKLGVDPSRIVAAGGSAGGHLAGATAILDGPDDPHDDLKISCRPEALVLFNPVVDTTPRGYGAAFIGPENEKLSLIDHIRGGLPPTIIFHGTADQTVPIATIERFVRFMKAAGNRCDLVSYPGGVHGFFNSPEFRPDTVVERYQDTLQRMNAFLISIGILRGTKR
jgi:acetyl esterase